MSTVDTASAVRRLLREFSGRRRQLALAVLTATAADLAALALIATAAWLIARAAEMPPMGAVTVAIVAVRALAIGRGVLRYLDRLAGHDAVLRCGADLRAAVFAALIPHTPATRAGVGDGELLTRAVSDVDAAQDLLLRCLLPAAVAAGAGVVAVGAATVALPAAGLTLGIALCLAGVVVPLCTARSSTAAARRTARLRAALADESVDLLRGAPELAAYGATATALAAHADTGRRLAAEERRSGLATAALVATGAIIQALAVLTVTVLAVTSGGLSGPLVAAMALGTLAALELVQPLVPAGQRWPAVAQSAHRLVELLDRPAPRGAAAPAIPLPLPRQLPALLIDRLSVRYPGGDRLALEGVDLRLAPGRRVALVGPSGSGKSTLIAALLRFVDPCGGAIRLSTPDGGATDLADHAGDDVRTLVRGALTDAHVFHASIRANLALAAPGVDDARLRAVADALRLTGWIESLPDGWDTVVGEDGRLVSGGQRQRLVLARAVFARPSVLVLDEPTESLDPATADAVLADVLRAAGAAAVLLATHRLTGLAAFDEIVVLDRGRVIQRGTHAELSARPGYYRERWRAESLSRVAQRPTNVGGCLLRNAETALR